MWRVINILLIAVILSSCSPQKRLGRIIEKHPELIQADSIEKIVYRDTVIFLTDTVIVNLPPDTLYLDTVIYFKKGFDLDTVKIKKGIINAEIWYLESHLGTKIYLDSTYIYQLQDSLKLLRVIKEKTVNKTKYVTIKEKSDNKLFLGIIGGLFFVVLILGGIILMIIKGIR